MKRSIQRGGLAAALATVLAAPAAQAAVAWDESVSGDLSGSGLTPTLISVALGSNQVLGTTGRVTSTDRDYFTLTVPVGLQLNALTLLPGSTALGVSFIGLQAGNQVTLPTNAADATGLLGWWHYGAADVGLDILGFMAKPTNGASGFSAPLGAGKYAFWVQDFGQGTASYKFDLVLGAVPEPASAALWLAGLAGLAGLKQRRRAG